MRGVGEIAHGKYDSTGEHCCVVSDADTEGRTLEWASIHCLRERTPNTLWLRHGGWIQVLELFPATPPNPRSHRHTRCAVSPYIARYGASRYMVVALVAPIAPLLSPLVERWAPSSPRPYHTPRSPTRNSHLVEVPVSGHQKERDGRYRMKGGTRK